MSVAQGRMVWRKAIILPFRFIAACRETLHCSLAMLLIYGQQAELSAFGKCE
jgi:hypothetical protein